MAIGRIIVTLEEKLKEAIDWGNYLHEQCKKQENTILDLKQTINELREMQ